MTIEELYKLRSDTCAESIRATSVMRAKALYVANILVRGLTPSQEAIQSYADADSYHTECYDKWKAVELQINERKKDKELKVAG